MKDNQEQRHGGAQVGSFQGLMTGKGNALVLHLHRGTRLPVSPRAAH